MHRRPVPRAIDGQPPPLGLRYPVFELMTDGRILRLTYGHWTQGESPWIAAVHFRPSEMLKRLGS